MTVKELKEKLELLIEDGKEDYKVYVDEIFDLVVVNVDDENKEVYV